MSPDLQTVISFTQSNISQALFTPQNWVILAIPNFLQSSVSDQYTIRYTQINKKYTLNTISLHSTELLPKKNAKLWQLIEFMTKPHMYSF